MFSKRPVGSMVFVLVLALSVSLTAAGVAAAKTTITVMDWRINSTRTAQEYFQTIKERFEELFPDAEVQYLDVSMNDIVDKLLTGVVTGTAPDVVTLSMLWARDLYEQGLLLELTDLVAKTPTHTPDQFIPVTQLYNQVGGEIFGITIAMDAAILFYNEDHFEEAGLDTDPYAIATWDEFTEAAKKLVRRQGDGSVSRYAIAGTPFNFARPEPFNSWLVANGGSFYADEGLTRAGFNTQAGRETLEHMYNLATVHEVVGGNFTSRTASMHHGVNSTPRVFLQQAPDMRFNMTSYPQGPSGTGRGTTVWGNMMSIPRSTTNVDLAWEYIKLFTSLEGSVYMFNILDYVGSPRFDFYQSPEWLHGQERHKWMRMIPEIVMVGGIYPYRRSTELAPIWAEHVQQAVAGARPLGGALEEAERLYNQVLSQ